MKKLANKVATVLKSSEFGFTVEGGNGRVKVTKEGRLQVLDSFYYYDEKRFQSKPKDFTDGCYGSYFRETLNVRFRLHERSVLETRTKVGLDRFYVFTFDVLPLD